MERFYETDHNGSEIVEGDTGRFTVWVHEPSTTGAARTMLRGKVRFAECKTLEDAKREAAIGQQFAVDMRTDTKGIDLRNTSNRAQSRSRCLEELPNERYDNQVLQDFRKIQDLIIEFGRKLEALTAAP